jgi:DNA-binding response OmpR family regulator
MPHGNVTLDLSGREFYLLECLLLNSSAVFSRYTSLDNVIEVHIARIRKIPDDPFPVKLLHTVRGLGIVLRKAERN